MLKIFFDLKKLKKPPQKVAYLSKNSVVSEIFHLLPTYCPTAQMAEFMFQNVVYRATVYITGIKGKYRTRAIISRGLYIFYPISKDHFFVFKEVFSENSVLMYGLYSRAACNQERLMMARVRYIFLRCF